MIPAGTIITGNHWSISHDTSVFSEDADEFIPERWFVDRKVELGVRKDLNHVQWVSCRPRSPTDLIADPAAAL